MVKELYIIRHGETDLNRLGIVQGRGINSDLNELGVAQGNAFYKLYQDVPFDKIYTSTLKRTHQTVKGFIDAQISWEQLEGLDELAWGIWEGKSSSDESRSAFRSLVEEWQNGNYDAKFEGGESPNEVKSRLIKAIHHIQSNTQEKRVLICMHGRAMRLLLCILTHKPLKEMADFPHQNTTLYKIQIQEGKASIIDFNNTDHLDNLAI
jgi:broad specificity phosphatase PhoE